MLETECNAFIFGIRSLTVSGARLISSASNIETVFSSIRPVTISNSMGYSCLHSLSLLG